MMPTTQTQAKEQIARPAEGRFTSREIAGRYEEPAWLAKRRAQAWALYQETPLPDRVSHLWRYSDPAAFVPPEGELLFEAGEDARSVREIKSIFDDSDHAGEAICHNGQLSYAHLDSDLEAQGVILSDLHTAARRHAGLVEPHLGRIVGAGHGKFEALNEALWQGGLFVYVPRNVTIEKPVHLLVTARNGLPFLAHRLLVVLEEGARLTLEDEYSSPRDSRFSANCVVEFAVAPGARLRSITLQRWGENVTSHFTQRAHVQRDGEVLSICAGLGGQQVKADVGSVLLGRGANVRLLGMSFAQHRQQFDQHTVHDHRAGETSSNLDYKVVLKDQARSAYTGWIGIARDAPNCEAYQENRSLLLSDQTRVETIPELEILTDEVRCTHGATIGPVDEETLFYLAARGIAREEAIRMVVGGFVEPTLKAVPEDLQNRLRSYVIDRVKEI